MNKALFSEKIVMVLWSICFSSSFGVAQNQSDTSLSNEFKQPVLKGIVLKSSNPIISDNLVEPTLLLKPKKTNASRMDVKATRQSLYIQSESKVFFESGEYFLSEKNKKHLDILIKDIAQDIHRFKENFGNEKIVMLISVEGFSDSVPFYLNQKIEERKIQNQLLSENRAKIISLYLKEKIGDDIDEVEFMVKGLGEATPPKSALKQLNRRFCEIYTLVYSESSPDEEIQENE